MDFTAALKPLKELFKLNKKQRIQLIEEARQQSVRHIISKGEMFNVLPYENELSGFKVKGKQIEKVLPNTECFIYYFDADDRIILIENYLEIWDKPYYYSCYQYEGDVMTFFNSCHDKMQHTGKCYYENGVVTRHDIYYNDDKVFCNHEYFYDNGVLKRINMLYVMGKYENFRDFNFYYNAKGVLETIQTVYDTGNVETCYTTVKVNWKKQEEQLTSELTEALTDFANECADEIISTLALDCYTGHGYMVLAANTNESIEENFGDMKPKERLQVKYDSPVDWEHYDIASVNLLNQPLDDKDIVKELQLITRVFAEVVSSDALKLLKKTNDFVCIVFDHNANILDDYPQIKKTVKNYPFFKSHKELLG